MKAPRNIMNAQALFASDLQKGDPVHVGVVGPGQVTNDAYYEGPLLRRGLGRDGYFVVETVAGVIVSLRGENVELPWGDLVEFWPIPATHGLTKGEREHRVQEVAERYTGS